MSYSASRRMVGTGGRWLVAMIALAGAMIVAGLAMVVFAVSARDDSPLFMLGGIILGAGVLRLTTALSADARRRRHPVDPDDPRWHDGVAPLQLAGRTCVECGRKIVIGADAQACEHCAQPAHVECREHHQANAHGELRFR